MHGAGAAGSERVADGPLALDFVCHRAALAVLAVLGACCAALCCAVLWYLLLCWMSRHDRNACCGALCSVLLFLLSLSLSLCQAVQRKKIACAPQISFPHLRWGGSGRSCTPCTAENACPQTPLCEAWALPRHAAAYRECGRCVTA